MRLALLAALSIACSKPKAVAERPLPSPTTDALWGIAPPDLELGIVVADGALPAVVQHVRDILALHERHPALAAGMTTSTAELTSWLMKVGLHGPSLKGDQGAAAFRDLDRHILVVLPGTAPTELGGWTCAAAAGRVLCSPQKEEVTEAVARAESGARREELAKLRRGIGDVEIYSGRSASYQRVLASLKILSDGLSASIRAEWDFEAGTLLSARPLPRTLRDQIGHAAGVVRLQIRRELIDELLPGAGLGKGLSGHMQLISAGSGVVNSALTLLITDGADADEQVRRLCDAAKSIPETQTGMADAACRVTVTLPLGMPSEIVVRGAGDRVVATMGPFDTKSLAGDATAVAGSPETLKMLREGTVVAWGRGFDAAYALGLIGAPSDSFDPIEMISWTGLHVYEIGARFEFHETFIDVDGRLTTFAGDPPGAQAAYRAALEKRATGDMVGYRAALAELARAHPGTLVARQAELVSTGYPAMGPLTAILAMSAVPAFNAYIERSKARAPK
jgi:hypothetical protein